MNRQALLLTAVGSLLVLALYWMFLLSPKRAELAETNEAIIAAVDQQAQLTNRINALKDVRAAAPAVEAQLAASEALLPSGPALPPTLRQLQLAADEAGLFLSSVSLSQPSPLVVEGVPAGVSQMSATLALTGSYFQVIDFLRRVADPVITPRAVLWSSVSLAVADYPQLSLSLSGNLFVVDREALTGSEQ